MTRKHFEALAAAIAEITNDDERQRIAESIGKVCAHSNALFDWQRWSTACNAGDMV